jgi:hypothetical protein
MRVLMASSTARAGRVNEDFVGASPTAVVLVDGAGIAGMEAICRHGVAWYAHSLGASLLGRVSLAPQRSITEHLGEAIVQVTEVHRHSCDVANPISPSATVAVARVVDGRIEHLVLGDSFVVLNRRADGPLVVTDPREVVIARRYEAMLTGVAAGSEEHDRIIQELRAHRNMPGGFWLAKDDPRAADEAVTGSSPASEVSSVALLSNGASRIVDRFVLADWSEVFALLKSSGPDEVIARVRRAETQDSVTPDDATLAYVTDFCPA